MVPHRMELLLSSFTRFFRLIQVLHRMRSDLLGFTGFHWDVPIFFRVIIVYTDLVWDGTWTGFLQSFTEFFFEIYGDWAVYCGSQQVLPRMGPDLLGFTGFSEHVESIEGHRRDARPATNRRTFRFEQTKKKQKWRNKQLKTGVGGEKKRLS